MSGILCYKRVPPHIKGKIYKVVVKEALLHGTETLPITKCYNRNEDAKVDERNNKKRYGGK